ncbi:MAG: alpha/beta hydrolase fold domain-containing protein, partial [Mucilaginibacter sp.]|nr:alpha/beta hydrolase fold domain-containing protein [Mucilaginibacter sp.]
SSDKATGIAVIIAPGGGHRELRIDGEGYWLAKKLQDKGIAAFVLKYRLANEPNATYTVDKDEVADIQRAIRLVKSKSTEWAIDTAKVGVMGFSAGGELAALAAMRFDNGKQDAPDEIDRLNSRPAFQALVYPGNSKRFEAVKNMPPAFLAAGYKDRADISEGIVQVYLRYKQGGVKTGLYIYTTAGHGFAADGNPNSSSSTWLDSFNGWLGDLGFYKKK